MLSDNQKKEKDAKVLLVVREFLKTKKTNKELEASLGIPASTIGRYLNDKETISDILGHDIYLIVQGMLYDNKINGLSKGGKTSQERYIQTRNENGTYSGNTKK